MTWRGMDTEPVQTLSADLRDAAARVQELATRLQSRLGETDWIGQDATRFRDDWESRLRLMLEEADAALAAAAAIADTHVRNQTAASG